VRCVESLSPWLFGCVGVVDECWYILSFWGSTRKLLYNWCDCDAAESQEVKVHANKPVWWVIIFCWVGKTFAEINLRF
jgi:hypothetical protein